MPDLTRTAFLMAKLIRAVLIAEIAVLALLVPIEGETEGSAPNPTLAALLSGVLPGAGHFYIRDWKPGVGYLGSTAGLIGIASVSRDEAFRFSTFLTAQNLVWYSMYDAYRDARIRNSNRGFEQPVSDEGLPKLAGAPFERRILSSRDFLINLSVDIGLSLGIGILLLSEEDTWAAGTRGNILTPTARFVVSEGGLLTLSTAIGVGEEALFRGTVQSELERRIGKTPGLMVAAALFAALHLPNGDTRNERVAASVSAFISGLVLGRQYQKNTYSLKKCIAHHVWYDFLVFSYVFLTDREEMPWSTGVQIHF